MIDLSFLKPVLFKDLKSYSFKMFRGDFVAGLTVSVISLPLVMALAIASGASPERGLFTSIVAGIIIALLGGSRHQVNGPTGAFVVVVYDVISKYGYDGLVIATLMAGVILIIAAFLNAGNVMRYIPHPVIVGFTAGIAVSLFTSQLRPFFGLDISHLPAHFIERWQLYFTHFFTLKWLTFGLGVFCLVAMIFLQRLKVKLPVFFLMMLFGGVFVWFFDLPIETIRSNFGALPTGLPAPIAPSFDWDRMIQLFPSAFTIAFLAGVEALLSSMVADGLTGKRHFPNTELFAQGVGNMASVIFGGLPVTGAIARTVTNVRSGAMTSVSGLVHGGLIFIFMWLLAPFVVWVPLTCLSAVMILVAWNMSEMKNFRYLMAAPRSDRIVLLVTFVTTVLVDLTVAVQVGMVLAALLFMKRMNDVTQIQASPSFLESSSEEFEASSLSKIDLKEVATFEIRGPFFFCVASRLKDELEKVQGVPKVFILKMHQVPAMDATAAHMLDGFLKKCRQQKTQVIFVGVQDQPHRVMRQMGLDALVGLGHFVHTSSQAIALAEKMI